MSSDDQATPPRKTPRSGEYLFSSAFLVSVGYGIYSRSLEDFIRYPGSITVIVTCLIYLRLAYAAYKEGRRPRKSFAGINFLVSGPPILSFVTVAVYYCLAISALDFFLWFEMLSMPPALRSAAWAFVALVTGLMLFMARLRLRAMYGLTEIAVGVAVVAHRAYSSSGLRSTELDFYLAILTAGVYLVVRGCDNVHTGLFKDPVDPMAAKLITIFGRATQPIVGEIAPQKSFGLVDLFFGIELRSEKGQHTTK